MRRKTMVAMLLAGGEGKRLAPYTEKMAKPALSFGAKYRIIDFTLSNCSNSGIDAVGVLTQYRPLVLSYHIGRGSAWGLDRKGSGVTILPPHIKLDDNSWYKGTANSVYQNIEFLDGHRPQYVLILSGDHIYKMDYAKVLDFHIKNRADATVCVREVPWKEASRFGIMKTDPDHRIVEFAEKPAEPTSNLASMGIYIFNWETLKERLQKDEDNPDSTNDFGRDVIPGMLEAGLKMMAYPFGGYWRDVGTIESLWEANMDLLNPKPELDMYDEEWPVVSVNYNQPAVKFGEDVQISHSLAGEGSQISGLVERSIISVGAVVEEGAVVTESILMPGAVVGKGTRLYRTILGEHAQVGEGLIVGAPEKEEITIINNYEIVGELIR